MASPPLTFVACTVFESNRTALPRAVKHIKAKTLSYLAVDEFSGPLANRGVARDLQVRSPQCASTARSPIQLKARLFFHNNAFTLSIIIIPLW